MMARPWRQPERTGLVWRVALACCLLWLTAGLSHELEPSRYDFGAPELSAQACRIVPAPAFTADPWTAQLLAARGNESDEEKQAEPADDNRDAEEERREPWQPDRGGVAFVPLAAELACIWAEDLAVGLVGPPPTVQRPLLHLVQTLLI